MTFTADTDMLEYVCNDNPRSGPHLVGRTEEEKKTVVEPDRLRRYVGTFRPVEGRQTATPIFTVSLENGQLFVALNGKGHIPLVPMSETTFSARLTGTLQFVVDPSGVVTNVLSHAAEGTTRYERSR
jgi:hypothetical protein